MHEVRPINLHIFLTPFKNESRVLKETSSLLKNGFYERIEIAALQDEGLAEHEQLDEFRSIWRVPLKTRRFSKSLVVQCAKYFEWLYRILKRYASEPVETIHCHSLSVLPIAVICGWVYGSKVIYDAHELETEIHGLKGPRKWLSKIVESLFIGETDAVLVVSDSIGKWYSERYSGLRTTTIRNVPVFKENPSNNGELRRIHGIPDSAILFLYQGALSRGRGIEEMLSAFSREDPCKHVVFMGYGELEPLIKERASQNSSIHFQSAVPPSKIMAYTAGADIGFVLTEKSCLSHEYSLPNKLFEYLLCGLAVIANDLPEVTLILDSFQCGWTLSQSDDLASLVSQLGSKDVLLKKANASSVANTCQWDKEEPKLLLVYSELLKHRRSAP